MSSRKNISNPTQVEVLVQSRRRCCICFGLTRDVKVKKGQIAHLDHNKNNPSLENLVFLCFDHHDEYDSQTSQSKRLRKEEVEKYRDELFRHFGQWKYQFSHQNLVKFLAFSIDIETMTDTAIRAGSSAVWYGESHAFDVLITDKVDYCDEDLYVPHLMVLNHFASWGWLTFTYEEKEMKDDEPRVYITVNREPVCDEVAKRIFQKVKERGQSVDGMINTAQYRRWKLLDTIRKG